MEFTWTKSKELSNGVVGTHWVLGNININPRTMKAAVTAELYLNSEAAEPLESFAYIVDVSSLSQNGALGNAVAALVQAKQDAE